MSDDETADDVPELQNGVGSLSGFNEMVLNAKRNNPSQFVSHWEMDEQDVNEATADEIKNDPVKRILWAAEMGDENLVSSMLDESPELISVVDLDGYTPLHRAAYEGHVNVALILLSRGADVDARTNDGWTALHSAANWGQADCAATLLRHGADINAQTVGLQTALHLAAANAKTVDIFKLLLVNEFLDTTLRNSIGETAGELAARSCRFHKMFEGTVDNVVNFLS